jgi:hypothetical protein
MKDLFASSRSALDSSIALSISQNDGDSSYSSSGRTPVMTAFLPGSSSIRSKTPTEDTPMLESSFASEEQDALSPLKSEADEDSDGVNTPRTFVTSMSDPYFPQSTTATAAKEVIVSPQIKSTRDLDLYEFGAQQRPMLKDRLTPPSHLSLGSRVNRSAESLVTARTHQDDWPHAPTKNSNSPSKSSSLGSDLVNQWRSTTSRMTKPRPPAQPLHMSRSSSRSSQTAGGHSEDSVATMGRNQSIYNGDDEDRYGGVRPESRTYNTWFADTPHKRKERAGIPSRMLHHRYRSDSSFSNRSGGTSSSMTLNEFRQADKLDVRHKLHTSSLTDV